MTHRQTCERESAPVWIKSSYSGADGPNCVEVGTTPDTIHIRDSKNPTGPRLTLTPTTWSAFLPYASDH